MILPGRAIKEGKVKGEALVSEIPISFFGCINPETGTVTEKGHPLEGKSIRNSILVFPYGKGSTVGSYSLYQLKKNNAAPLGIINRETEAIIAMGVIISDIPCVDQVDISKIKTGDKVLIEGNKVMVNE